MATKKQKYFLVDENDSANIYEFDSREDVREFLKDNDALKERCDNGYNSGHLSVGDTGFRLFKGVEVDIEVEADALKVTLTDR